MASGMLPLVIIDGSGRASTIVSAVKAMWTRELPAWLHSRSSARKNALPLRGVRPASSTLSCVAAPGRRRPPRGTAPPRRRRPGPPRRPGRMGTARHRTLASIVTIVDCCCVAGMARSPVPAARRAGPARQELPSSIHPARRAESRAATVAVRSRGACVSAQHRAGAWAGVGGALHPAAVGPAGHGRPTRQRQLEDRRQCRCRARPQRQESPLRTSTATRTCRSGAAGAAWRGCATARRHVSPALHRDPRAASRSTASDGHSSRSWPGGRPPSHAAHPGRPGGEPRSGDTGGRRRGGSDSRGHPVQRHRCSSMSGRPAVISATSPSG
jgi:hypothetical protein